MTYCVIDAMISLLENDMSAFQMPHLSEESARAIREHCKQRTTSAKSVPLHALTAKVMEHVRDVRKGIISNRQLKAV
jgi:hypothetical protein